MIYYCTFIFRESLMIIFYLKNTDKKTFSEKIFFVLFSLFILNCPSLLWSASGLIDEEALRYAKKEAVAIHNSIIANEMDFLAWQTESGHEIFSKESLEEVTAQAQRNIQCSISQINYLERLHTVGHVVEFLHSFISDRVLMVKEGLENVEKGSVCFILGMPTYHEKVAKRAISLDSHTLACLKIFTVFAPAENIERIFNPHLTSTSIYAGYFLHLQTYFMDLTHTIPNLHSWLYRHASQEESEPLPKSLKGAALLRAKLVKQKLHKLLNGPLKILGEEEREIESLWQAYKKGEVKPGDWKKVEKAVQSGLKIVTEEPIESLIDESSIEQSQEKERRAAKNKKKKEAAPRKQEKEKEAKAEADAVSAREGTTILPVELEEQTVLTPSEAAESSSVSHAIVEEDQEETAEAEPSYQFKPFATLDSTSSQPSKRDGMGGTASTPILKRRIYTKWDQFWTGRFMEWTDFRTLFVNGLDFGYEPTSGSIRKFWYPNASREFFVVHEPHGDRTTVGPATLHNIRENLERNFGWSEASFRSE